MTLDLFEDAAPPPWRETIAPGAVVLHGFVREHGTALLAAVQSVVAEVPWRHMTTPGGLHHVGSDELVRPRLEQRQPRLSLYTA